MHEVITRQCNCHNIGPPHPTSPSRLFTQLFISQVFTQYFLSAAPGSTKSPGVCNLYLCRWFFFKVLTRGFVYCF